MSRVLLTALLPVAAIGLSACSVSFGNSHEIDPKKTEKLLEDNVRPKPTSVSCPSGIKVVKGGAFTCTIVLPDGQTGTVTMHMTDGKGDVHVANRDIHLNPRR